MASQKEIALEALQKLNELKKLKEYLRHVANNFQRLEKALNDPIHYSISGIHSEGYGENYVDNIQMPDLKVLDIKMQKYQQKHYELTMKLADLSPAVRALVKQGLN